jgi:hypothetical protein
MTTPRMRRIRVAGGESLGAQVDRKATRDAPQSGRGVHVLHRLTTFPT